MKQIILVTNKGNNASYGNGNSLQWDFIFSDNNIETDDPFGKDYLVENPLIEDYFFNWLNNQT